LPERNRGIETPGTQILFKGRVIRRGIESARAMKRFSPAEHWCDARNVGDGQKRPSKADVKTPNSGHSWIPSTERKLEQTLNRPARTKRK
jgi:hypothetical protein